MAGRERENVKHGRPSVTEMPHPSASQTTMLSPLRKKGRGQGPNELVGTSHRQVSSFNGFDE